MRRLPTLLLTLTAAATSCAPAPDSAPRPVSGTEGEGVLGEWVYSGEYRRSYILALPDNTVHHGPRPILVMMHGAGGTADGLRRWSGMDSVATAAGYVVVFPEGLHRSWDLGCGDCTPAGGVPVNDIRTVETLVRALARELPVDTTRLFVAGHSLGGQYAHYYGCEAELRPAGIAAVAGLWQRSTARSCPERPGLDVLIIHGDRDPILPWDGPRHSIGALSVPEALAWWTRLLGCDVMPRYVDLPDTVGDGTTVTTTEVSPCPGQGRIRVHRVRGGGHGWPGSSRTFQGAGPTTGNLDGAAAILDFFGSTSPSHTGGSSGSPQPTQPGGEVS